MQWNNSIRRWLAAERSSDDGAAEKALREVFAMLSDPIPSSSIAAAVLQRIDMRRVPAAVPVAARWAVAAAMIAAAFSFAAMPLTVLSLKGLFELSASVELVGTTLVAGSAALASWLEFWRSLAELDRVLLNIVSKPQIAALSVVILGISLAALGLLSRLTASDRSRGYA